LVSSRENIFKVQYCWHYDQKKEFLPEDIASDEKHGKRLKDKIYIATTVAAGCILGAQV
jgi:hypothetical protein